MTHRNVEWIEKEFPRLERLFSKIAPVLNLFAEKHDLFLQKYHHHARCWDFFFRNPKGGYGLIMVWLKDDCHIGIDNVWDVADYRKLRRYVKHTEMATIKLDSENLLSILEDSLKEILSWTNDQLIADTKIYHEWSEVSEEDFYKSINRYSFPK